MLDANIKLQLKEHFSKIRRPVVLQAALDDSAESASMSELLDEVALLSDNISVRRDDSDVRRPSFAVTSEAGTGSVRFACIPTGHEFTSFILAILQIGGHPARISEEDLNTIRNLHGPLHFEVFISLSCHNCPEVVQSLNLMAVLNPQVSVTVIDGALFREEAQQRKIMAVPTVFLNGEMFVSGRRELGELLQKLDSDAAEAVAHRLSEKAPFDLLVIGGGPAGSTAAIYAARKGIRTGLITDRIGGQVNDTAEIGNFTSVISAQGRQLAQDLALHIKNHEIDLIAQQKVVTVEKTDALWKLTTHNGAVLRCRSLIIASGARHKKLGIPGETELTGKGVAYCPHCDGPLFRDRPVAVVGGGNSAVEAAIDLSGICSHVTLLHRGPALSADRLLQTRLSELPNVTVKFNTSPQSCLESEGKLSGVVCLEKNTGTEETLPVDGLFVQIGISPETEPFRSLLECNSAGEIVVNPRCQTSEKGIFAAGDCTDVPFKQIVIALGEGAKASLSAFEYLMLHSAD